MSPRRFLVILAILFIVRSPVWALGIPDLPWPAMPDFPRKPTPLFGKIGARPFEESDYYYYFPYRAGAQKNKPLPVLVLIPAEYHEPEIYLQRWIQVAEAKRFALIAFTFDRDEYPEFETLNIKGNRADHKLFRLLEDVSKLWPIQRGRVALYGHGAGGAFVQRIVLLHPDRVDKYILSSAQSYTLLDPAATYPKGLQTPDDAPDLKLNGKKFLQIPGIILVGGEDVEQIIDEYTALEGVTRPERGKFFYEMMKRYAEIQKVTPKIQFHILPRATHSPKDYLQPAADFLAGE